MTRDRLAAQVTGLRTQPPPAHTSSRALSRPSASACRLEKPACSALYAAAMRHAEAGAMRLSLRVLNRAPLLTCGDYSRRSAHATLARPMPQVHDKLQDLKRTEYKNRNAQIEAEEQAKLAAKYNIERPLRLSHDRAGAREAAPKARASTCSNGAGKGSPAAELPEEVSSKMEAGAAAAKIGDAGAEAEAAGEEDGEKGGGDASALTSLAAVESISDLAGPPSGSDAGDAASTGGCRASPALRGADTEPCTVLGAADLSNARDSPGGGSVVGGDEEGAEAQEGEEGAGGAGSQRREAEGKRKRSEHASKAAAHVRRGDLDQMRIRKDELRKQLDDDFIVLAGRIGRLRQEPIGLDRDRREYMVLGGPVDGQQLGADLSRLLIRERPQRGAEGRETGLETWRCIRCGARASAAYACPGHPRDASRRRADPTLTISPAQRDRRARRPHRLFARAGRARVPLAQSAHCPPHAFRRGHRGHRARRRRRRQRLGSHPDIGPHLPW